MPLAGVHRHGACLIATAADSNGLFTLPHTTDPVLGRGQETWEPASVVQQPPPPHDLGYPQTSVVQRPPPLTD